MAQYIRTPCNPDFNNVAQVCQCVYHDERVFEIFYDNDAHRVLVQEFNDYFWLTSPDIEHITIYQVLTALGYTGEQIVVTWADNQHPNNLLNSIVEQAPLGQISIYSPNQPIPQEHNPGPFPAIAGQPMPDDVNAPVDDDQNAPIEIDDNNDDDNGDAIY
jgi:hypothetical protein